MSTYEKTMERLRKLSAGQPVTEHIAIEMLSYEIESYRARVEDMREQINNLKKETVEKDCTKCGYGPVWNDVCRACKAKSAASRESEGKAAGSGTTARRTETDNIKDHKIPEKDLHNITEWIQRLIYRIRALPPADTAEPLEGPRTCPFCGGHVTVVEQGAGIRSAWVECGQCGARTRTLFGDNKVDRVIAAWNRRTPEA